MKIDKNHIRKGRWILVPKDDLMTPKTGRICYGGSWWAFDEEDNAYFFESYGSPQCNRYKGVVDRSLGFGAPETTPKWVEMAFIPHNCNDYV